MGGATYITHIRSLKRNGCISVIVPLKVPKITFQVKELKRRSDLKMGKTVSLYSGLKLVFTNESNASLTRKNTTASLDRIDSKIGYIEGNVQWVHKDINKMKNSHTHATFLQWCRLCVDNCKVNDDGY